jgi:hypothetical protein
MKWPSVIMFSIILGGGLAVASFGQETETRYSAEWTRVSLIKALPELARETGIDLIYDDTLVRGRIGHCAVHRATAEEMLRCLVQSAGLDFVRTSAGTYVIVEPPRRKTDPAAILGRVSDASTGKPLKNAHVLLAEARTGTATQETGEFSFSGLLPGAHRIVITHVGFEAAVVNDLSLQPGEIRTIEVTLHPAEVSSETIIVDGLQQRLSSRLVEYILSPRERAEAIDVTRDVMRSAASTPGVAAYRSLADLHVQGGAVGEHATLLDGTPVRDPVSFGRYLGAFSPLAVASMTIHKSGFNVRHGSHLSGVLALEHDVDTQGASVHLDPVSFNARLSGGLPANGRLRTMVAARTSIWNQYQAPDMAELLHNWSAVDPVLATAWIGPDAGMIEYDVIEFHPGVRFSDIHAAMRYEPASHLGSLSASVFRAGNRIDTRVHATSADGNGDALAIADDYDWTNWAAHVRYQRLLDRRTFGTIRVSASDHASGYDYAADYHGIYDRYAVASDVSDEPFRRYSAERHTIREVTLGMEAMSSLVPRHTVEGGLEFRFVDASFAATSPFIRFIDYADSAFLLAAHLGSTYTPGLRTTIETGVRMNVVPQRQTVYAEPRMSLRYDLDAVALRASAGLFRQFIHQFELSSPAASTAIPSMLFWLPVEATTAPPRAYHVALDALFAPRGPFVVQADVYYKRLPRVLALDHSAGLSSDAYTQHPTPPTLSDLVEAGRGYAVGTDIRMQYDSEPIRGAIAYGFTRSRRAYPGRFDGRMTSVPWEEPHRLTADARLQLWRLLAARASWRTSAGRTWPLRRAYYDYQPHLGQAPLLGSPSETLPPAHRLDLAIMLDARVGEARASLQFSVLNVLDQRMVFDQSAAMDGSRVDRRMPGRRPAFALTLRR